MELVYSERALATSRCLLEQIETVHVSEHTDSGQDLIHELGVRDHALQLAVEASREPRQFALRRMEAIPLHQSLQVFSIQMPLPESVDAGESVMDVERRAARQLLLGDLDPLVDMEVSLEALEEEVARLLGEVGFLGN